MRKSLLVLFLFICLGYRVSSAVVAPANETKTTTLATNITKTAPLLVNKAPVVDVPTTALKKVPDKREDGHDDGDFHENLVLEEESPYILIQGQGWVLNVWQWLMVTPQHSIYIPEPHLPWYGNLIKWLRINVLFKPVY